ncbi:peptidase C39-like protein [Kineothrix alysoides]|uniref:Peptidase C39-like protein n=1 Tax=Kineothrix alysoides TaxID=1469948 RepID=A0A4R1QXS2_9FIRM|nr:C39 family peptidase [Kineothrix alysoides]TCL56200.1 peptidase C39-like protein [Kineothrix alysoides]
MDNIKNTNEVFEFLLKIPRLNYNCFQMALAYILQFYHREYQAVSLGNWGFKYNQRIEYTDCIGNAIDEVFRYKIKDILMRYYGSELIGYDPSDETAVIYMLKEAGLILVRSDLYWCPWSLAYLKHHFSHYYLLVGYDKKSEDFYCYDPYLNNGKINQVPFEKIKPGIISYEMLCSTKGKTKNENIKENIKKDIYSDITSILDKQDLNSLYNIYQLVDSINYRFELEKENAGFQKDFLAIPILSKMKFIYISRYGYSDLLEYYGNSFNNKKIIEAANNLTECGRQWRVCQSLLMKVFIHSHDKGKVKVVSNSIAKIADNEISIAEDLFNL